MIFDLWCTKTGDVVGVSRYELPGCFPLHRRGLYKSYTNQSERYSEYAETDPAEIDVALWKKSGYVKMGEFSVARATEAHIDFNTLMQCYDEVRGVRNASLAHYEDDIQNALAGLLGRSYRLAEDRGPPEPEWPSLTLLVKPATPSRYDFWEAPCGS